MTDCIQIVNVVIQSVLTLVTLGLLVVGIQAWRIARRSAEQQLRAYLGASYRWIPEIADQCLDQKTLGTAIFVSNHGQTPARNVRFRGATKILPASPSTAQIDQVVIDAKEQAPRPCPPQGVPLYFQMQCHDTPRGCSAGERVYAVGSIEYDDVFDKRRCTKFCTYWTEHGWAPDDQRNSAT